MAKREREEVTEKHGSLEELCRNIKRLHTVSSENLDSSNGLHLQAASPHDLDALEAKAVSIIAAATGRSCHQQLQRSSSIEGDARDQNCPLGNTGLGGWPASYEDANKLLKELYLERCARLAALTGVS